MDLIKLNDDIAVGGQPRISELEELRQKGFRSIVNLRRSGEDLSQPHPDSERDEARRLGMKYAHIPLRSSELDDDLTDLFAVVLTSLDKPVYVHCATGKRSGALAVSAIGATSDDPEHAIEQAEARGIELGSLERFVRRYIERRSGVRGDGDGRDNAAAATMLNEWLDRLVDDARAGRVAATSAGAGQGRDYAYLHYRTIDRRHSVVVFRPEGDGPHLRTFTFEDQPDGKIASLVDRATHRRKAS